MQKFLKSEGFRTRLIVCFLLVAVMVPSYFLFDGVALRILLGFGFLIAILEIGNICFETRFFPSGGDISLAAFLGTVLIFGGLSLTSVPLQELGAMVVICVATDVGAYLVGKAVGKTHLPKSISPNKTFEGSIGGLAIGMIVAMIWTRDATLIWVPFVAFFGDILESTFKRRYGVKDSNDFLIESGNTLIRMVEGLLGGRKGHGGYFDRLDSLSLVLFIHALLTTFYP